MSRLLQSLSIPTTSWQVISLNFGEGLPPAWSKNYIFGHGRSFFQIQPLHTYNYFNVLQVAIDFMEKIYNLKW